MLHNFKTAEETEDLSYFCINWFRRMQTRGWLPWTSKHDFSGNNSSGQFMSGKKPCSVPFLDPGCQWEQGSFLLFFSFSVFLLGLADSCLANNSRLHSDEGSKLLMDKIVVLHNLENLACKFYPGLKQIQAWQRYACFWSELFPIFSSSSRCCVNSKKHKSLESWKKRYFISISTKGTICTVFANCKKRDSEIACAGFSCWQMLLIGTKMQSSLKCRFHNLSWFSSNS